MAPQSATTKARVAALGVFRDAMNLLAAATLAPNVVAQRSLRKPPTWKEMKPFWEDLKARLQLLHACPKKVTAGSPAAGPRCRPTPRS